MVPFISSQFSSAFSLCTQMKTGLKMKGTTYREEGMIWICYYCGAQILCMVVLRSVDLLVRKCMKTVLLLLCHRTRFPFHFLAQKCTPLSTFTRCWCQKKCYVTLFPPYTKMQDEGQEHFRDILEVKKVQKDAQNCTLWGARSVVMFCFLLEFLFTYWAAQ